MFRRPHMVPSLRLPPITAVVALVLSVPVAPAAAQDRRAPTPAPAPARDSVVDIPESMMPPAGKCRIWMLNVPAKQQPASTDCTTALRQKPANAVLVFGPAVRDLSPFEVQKFGRPRRDEVGRTADRAVGRTGRSDGDTTRRGDARDRNDSSAGVPARRVEGRNAESRRAEPPKKSEPAKPDVKRPASRRPDVRKPAPRKTEVRTPAPRTPDVKRPAPRTPDVRKPPTRRPVTPVKKPERP